MPNNEQLERSKIENRKSKIGRFALATAFLTRLPVPGRWIAPFEELGKSAAYFPAVGLVVGGLVAAAAMGVAHGWHSPLLAGAIAVIVNALVTGGLHLDGLMDTCDGLFGGATRERALEIMGDPRVGSFGVLGGRAALMLRLLLSAGAEGPAWQALLLAPVAGRCVQVWAVVAFPYARAEGKGKAFDGAAGRIQAVWATLSAVAFCLCFAGPAALLWLAGAWLAGAVVAWRIHCRLQGLTGDGYGAVTEVAEWAALAIAWLVPGA